MLLTAIDCEFRSLCRQPLAPKCIAVGGAAGTANEFAIMDLNIGGG
jgi:hypothetical protein